MSRNSMLGQLQLATTNLSNDGLKEILAQANLCGGPDGPAWIAHLSRTRKAGLPEAVASAAKPKADIIIRVDRAASLTYPDWVEKKVVHPELEHTGPAEYGLCTIEEWLHDRQKNGDWCKGEVIHDYLKSNNILGSCFGLADLQAIQRLGIGVFRKYFKGKAVFGWRSVVRRRFGSLGAPYLIEDDDKVVLGWRWLGYDWFDVDPALRFES